MKIGVSFEIDIDDEKINDKEGLLKFLIYDIEKAIFDEFDCETEKVKNFKCEVLEDE